MASTRSGAKRHGEKLDDWWRSPDTRDPPLHRQGHHVLSHAVLAGHAQDGRLSACRRRSTSTASSPSTARRCRRARARSSRPRRTSSISTRRICATTTPRKLGPRVDDLDLNLDEFVDQGELRPRRQGREPRQPHGEVRRRRAGSVEQLSRRRRPVRQAARARATRSPRPTRLRLQPAMRVIMALADRANQFVDAGSRGSSARTRRAPLTCRTSAPSRSTCFGRSSSTWRPCCRGSPKPPSACLTRRSPHWRRLDAARRHRGRDLLASDATCRPQEVRSHDGAGARLLLRPSPPTTARRSPPSRSPPSARSTTSPKSTCASPACWRPKKCPKPTSCSS